ncbi:hypothetical protein H0H92_004293, partial [Tricholoma furcatifolium]
TLAEPANNANDANEPPALADPTPAALVPGTSAANAPTPVNAPVNAPVAGHVAPTPVNAPVAGHVVPIVGPIDTPPVPDSTPPAHQPPSSPSPPPSPPPAPPNVHPAPRDHNSSDDDDDCFCPPPRTPKMSNNALIDRISADTAATVTLPVPAYPPVVSAGKITVETLRDFEMLCLRYFRNKNIAEAEQVQRVLSCFEGEQANTWAREREAEFTAPGFTFANFLAALRLEYISDDIIYDYGDILHAPQGSRTFPDFEADTSSGITTVAAVFDPESSDDDMISLGSDTEHFFVDDNAATSEVNEASEYVFPTHLSWSGLVVSPS